MKIAIFENLPFGGALKVVSEEAKYLSKNNDVDYYTLSNQEKNKMNLKYVNNIFRYPFSLKQYSHSYSDRIMKDYKSFLTLKILHKDIARYINNQNYNVVLVHPDMYTESPYLLRYLKIPSVYYSHELLRIAYEDILQIDKNLFMLKRMYEKAVRMIRRKIDKINAKSASSIITNSIFIASKIKISYDTDATVCYPGVNTQLYYKSAAKEISHILYIGGKNKLKGYDFASDSISKVDNKYNVKLNVLGYGSGDRMITNERILSKRYSKSLLLLCPAHDEPFGLVALESMACETPVLAVNEGGYKETIIDGVTGYLLPRDPKVFAEKIEYLYDHPDIARKMGKAGREHVKKNFTWEKHVKCIEKQLYEIANCKKVL